MYFAKSNHQGVPGHHTSITCLCLAKLHNRTRLSQQAGDDIRFFHGRLTELHDQTAALLKPVQEMRRAELSPV